MKSSDKFMSALFDLAKNSSMHAINPDDEEEFIIDDKVAIEMTPISGKDNYIHFISIRALHPGKNHGSVAIKKIFKLVDDNNIILLGKVMPYHTQDITKENLRKWYRKFDCRPLDPSNEDGLWIRTPRNNKNNVIITLDPLTKFKIERGFSEADFIDRIQLVKYLAISMLVVLSVYLFKK